MRSIFHMDRQEQVYKARFVICLRKNRLWHDILYWPVYIKHRTTYIEWRRKIILHFRGSDCKRYLSSTRYDMMDSFLMDRDFWVPTFKVECRRLGYVDDLTRWTHGRCYDKRILEWCLGYSTQTRKQECGILQMDLQEQVYKAKVHDFPQKE